MRGGAGGGLEARGGRGGGWFRLAKMKLLKKKVDVGGAGFVKLVPEDPEDMWHLYNLVCEGDRVTCKTFRKVRKETGGEGQGDTERMKFNLTVGVESVEYDGEAQRMRLKGRNATENKWVGLGAYHTLEVEPQRAVSLEKDVWDRVDLDRIQKACDPGATADLAALLLQEGQAILCLVGGSCTVVRARIESSIPKKRGAAAAGYDKAMEKFFAKALAAVTRHVDFTVVKCLILAGPGFTKDEFLKYLDLEASRQNLRPLIENRRKVFLTHASSAYKHSLKEVLAQENVMAQIKDTQAAQEVKVLERFFRMLSDEPERAFYGPGHVSAAAELGAVEDLLLSDELFRNKMPATRRQYMALVDSVKEAGGKAHIFSAMHVSGEQLGKLTGICAILRFPLPDLEDAEVDDPFS